MGNKEKLRIVFMGTPDFAVASLSKLVDSGYTIVGVITAPDKPSGRGRKLQESAVKHYALQKGLTILQPSNLKSSDFLRTLKSLNANLQIVVAFRMLPNVVWQMPKYGTFNLHASLLPQYRGAAPINWAIMNGEMETGVTTFFIDDNIDTGEIILQKKTTIRKEDTAGTLHDGLMHLGAHLVLETVSLIEKEEVQTKKQINQDPIKLAPKIFKETCEIDWNGPIWEIYNFIRGLSPYPTAWTTLQNGSEKTILKIYSASIETKKHDLRFGKVLIDKKEMKVAGNGGFINLLEIQLAGKKKMKTSDALNGLNLMDSAVLL